MWNATRVPWRRITQKETFVHWNMFPHWKAYFSNGSGYSCFFWHYFQCGPSCSEKNGVVHAYFEGWRQRSHCLIYPPLSEWRIQGNWTIFGGLLKRGVVPKIWQQICLYQPPPPPKWSIFTALKNQWNNYSRQHFQVGIEYNSFEKVWIIKFCQTFILKEKLNADPSDSQWKSDRLSSM